MLHVQHISIDDFLSFLITTVGAKCRFAVVPLHDLMTAQMATRLTLRSFKHEENSVTLKNQLYENDFRWISTIHI